MTTKKPSLRSWLAIICATTIALLVYKSISFDVLSRIDEVIWEVNHQQPLRLSVTHQKRYSTGTVNHGWVSKDYKASGKTTSADFGLYNYPTAYFSAVFQGEENRWEITSVTLSSAFGKTRVLQGNEIIAAFKPANANTSLALQNDIAVVNGKDDKAVLETRRLQKFSNPFILFGIPLLSALLAFLMVSRIEFQNLVAIRLMHRDVALSAGHSLELDGLRGLAAISVVADHTWGLFTGSGLTGVWIFFALSGYLLSIPFVRQPERVFDGDGLARFYLRRLARIVPMYYCVIFIYYCASGHVHLAVTHFLFLQGDGHFWTITQEMLFYLLLPMVLVVMALLCRINTKLAVFTLILVTGFLLAYPKSIPITLISSEFENPAYIAWFLVGVIASYLVNSDSIDIRSKLSNVPWLGWFALCLLVVMIIFSSREMADTLTGVSRSYAKSWNGWYGLGAGILIITAVVCRDSTYSKILRWAPFRSFGVIGYSAYLIHPLLLEIIIKFTEMYHMTLPPGYVLFVATLLVT